MPAGTGTCGKCLKRRVFSPGPRFLSFTPRKPDQRGPIRGQYLSVSGLPTPAKSRCRARRASEIARNNAEPAPSSRTRGARSRAGWLSGGNHRLENVWISIPSGFKTRPTFRNTSRGHVRYSTETVQITRSKAAFANGISGFSFKSWST